MTLPGALLPWVELRFLKVTADGLVPNSGGFVEFRETDLTTLQDTYSNSTLATANSNPIELDSDGRPPDPIYLLPTGYSVYVYDADMVPLYDLPFVEDVGATFLAQSAVIQTEGTVATSSPYIVVPSDNMVIVDSATNPFVVQLPPAADRGTPLIVKNISAVSVRVTPDSTELVEDTAAYYTMPAASSPLLPSVVLLSDGVSAWWISSGLGI